MDLKPWTPDSEGIEHAFKELMDSGEWWLYVGERVKELERRFAAYHDCRFGVAVCNGTAALDIILKGLGIGKGDEVILPAYDFYSLPVSVKNAGAEPVFVDVRRDNFTIEVDGLESRITPRTRAVVAVHISGSVAELDRLAEFCAAHRIHLIEDCAQAHGAVYAGRKAGSWGTAGLFSFGGVKLMTSGQGGIITTSNEELFNRCHAIVNRGMLSDGTLNTYGIVGENYQLSEIAAALLLPQLARLERLCEVREKAFGYLDSQLSQVPGITTLAQFPKTSRRAQMRYAFLVRENSLTGKSIDEFVKALVERGCPAIPAGAYSSVTHDSRLQGRFAAGEEFPAALYGQRNIVLVHHTFLVRPKEVLDGMVKSIKDLMCT